MSALLRTTVCGAAIAAVGIAAALPANATSAKPRTTLEKAPAWTAKAHAKASAKDSQKLRLSVTLKLRDAAGAEALAKAVSSPSSPSYRKFVSAAKWRKSFAPTDASVSKVTTWLHSSGFTVGTIPANHRTVAFTGTVKQAEKAFGTNLKTYKRRGLTVVAPTTAVSVPTTLAGVVAGVSGLDTSAMRTTNVEGGHVTKGKGSTLSTKVTPKDELPPPPGVLLQPGPCSAYYGEKAASNLPAVDGLHPLTWSPCGYKPGQIRSAYETSSSLKAGLDGRGATIAIVDPYASPTMFQDAQTYSARNDANHPFRSYQYSEVRPASYTEVEDCDAAGWYGEQTLDVEAAHAVAPAANILFVSAQSCEDPDIDAAVNTIVDNQMAMVVSNSYGEYGELPAADVAGEHETSLQAAAEGISLLFAAGDDGDEVDNTGLRQPDNEGNEPFVTAVGGTSLAIDKDGQYMWEQAWGTGRSVLTKGAWNPLPPAWYYGGGGGESNVYAEPWYQKGVVPNAMARQTLSGKPGRTVPDVSMLGDNAEGLLVGESQTDIDGKVRYSEDRYGGTSLSTPLYAGFTALMDQSVGGSLGFLNPLLYQVFYNTTALRDVDHGRKVTDALVKRLYNVDDDVSSGTTTELRTINQSQSIYTRKGYDDVTGVGSPVGDVTFTFLSGLRHHSS